MALPGDSGVILFAYYKDNYSDVYGTQGLNAYCTYSEFKGASVAMSMEYTKTTDPIPAASINAIQSAPLMNTTAPTAGAKE